MRLTALRDFRHRFRGAATAVIVVGVGFSSCSRGSPPYVVNSLYQRDIHAGIHDIAPVRATSGGLRLHRDGKAEKCSSCHEGLSGDQDSRATKDAHPNLVLDHGLNLLCLNCHHRLNSDAYVYHDGSEIPAEEPNRLCAKCHGTHYRDYTLGIHGRRNGFWNSTLGEQKTLDCIQCHDPHRPRFPAIKPDPPPVLVRFNLRPQGAHAHGS